MSPKSSCVCCIVMRTHLSSDVHCVLSTQRVIILTRNTADKCVIAFDGDVYLDNKTSQNTLYEYIQLTF